MPIKINKFKVSAIAAAFVAATSAHAASISIETYDPGNYPGVPGFTKLEGQNFDNFAGDPSIDATDTFDVGVFQSLGGIGSGGTVTGAPASCQGAGAAALCIRDGYVFGRESTRNPNNGQEGQFLDTNDTHGIGWNVSLEDDSYFNTVVFTLSDASDQGAYVAVTASQTALGDDPTPEDILNLDKAFMTPPQANGNVQTVVIQFDEYVTEGFINIVSFLAENGEAFLTNDGLSIDGIKVGIAPIPVPAAGFLLVGALGGLGFVGRRRRKTS
ncbi:VPLPA-CTERM sorting domain-containing protein [uncultured Shimia sp.]|uniref:VPLPA-CTERM sorting domain-containing protein n=1 Tax=uncultured Shimia sp. TaxID=573152 RepID=UPI00260DE9E8|nr:VPLPA-CTERM sorting domain-containing protein [uncultured Shimia sp.]